MLENINWSQLFPTKLSIFIFISYMVLFINQGIFVTASQGSDSAYSYNTVTVVLLTEAVKLLVSIGLYCKDHSVVSLLKETTHNSRVMLLYFVPAFLYCLYNNLAFINLSAFDPTTYYLLLQFRVVVTGIIFQSIVQVETTDCNSKSTTISRIPTEEEGECSGYKTFKSEILFKKQLSSQQWISLILLTAGCMIKQVDISSVATATNSTSTTNNEEGHSGFHFSINLLFIFVQTLCSCLAGVYNEYLLKGEGANVNIFIQNVFMYVDSIVCNAGILLCQGNLLGAFTAESLATVFQFKVIIIMFNNAAIGIITSFFLKNLNSILKTFASALELMFTAILCWILFGIPIYVNTVIAISIVSYAVILYSQNPVVNPAPKQVEEREPFLKGDEPVAV